MVSSDNDRAGTCLLAFLYEVYILYTFLLVRRLELFGEVVIADCTSIND